MKLPIRCERQLGSQSPLETELPRMLAEHKGIVAALRRLVEAAKAETSRNMSISPHSCIWADFLRRHMKRQLVERDFESAVAEALRLVRSLAARLPGLVRIRRSHEWPGGLEAVSPSQTREDNRNRPAAAAG